MSGHVYCSYFRKTHCLLTFSVFSCFHILIKNACHHMSCVSVCPPLFTRSLSRARWLHIMERKRMLRTNKKFFDVFGLMSNNSNHQLQQLIDNKAIGDFNFKLKLTEEPKAGILGSRTHFGQVVQKVVHLNGREHCCESRNTPTVGTFKPDYLLRQSAGQRGQHSIILVGEVKSMAARKGTEFPDEEVGQILDFLKELLLVQGWRQWAFGFLTDTFRIEFFRAVRGVNGVIEFQRSTLFTAENGWKHLNQMMNGSDEALGFVPVEIPGWSLGAWLGSGSTASVFAASSREHGEAVCKVYLKENDPCRENEARALHLLKDDPSTPTIIENSPSATVAGNSVILVTPKGVKLGLNGGARVPIKSFSNIVDTLEASHMLGLCHCDVCPDNMYGVARRGRHQLFDVILNDWGSSMMISEINSVEPLTHPRYNDVDKLGFEEDLAALVRSVFELTQLTFQPVNSANELDVIMQSQWLWGAALQLALDRNYAALKLFFNEGTVDIKSNNK
jgi:hypothetical protein